MWGKTKVESHAADNITLNLREDGKIELNLVSKRMICHNVFGKDAARSIVKTLEDIASGKEGRYIAADTDSKTKTGIDFESEPHFLIHGYVEEDHFMIFAREGRHLFGYVSTCKDPAIVAIRDVLRMWTA